MNLSAYTRYTHTLLLYVSITLLAAQALYLSQTYDAYVLIQGAQIQGWQSIFGYLGNIARWGLVFIAAFGLLLNIRLMHYWQHVIHRFTIKNALSFGAMQLLSFGLLLHLTHGIFAPEHVNTKPFYWYVLWLISAAACALFWALMWAKAQSLLHFLKTEYPALLLAILAATFIVGLSAFTKTLWGPLADYTFDLATLTLSLLSNGDITSLKEERILGLEDFLINIAPVCSGYEGIGLISAFTTLYLYTHKSQLRFPQSFILFPLGILCIWLLNVVRIVTLILIGAHWSPEVAIGGFHSFGGWIAFILVSLGLLWLASGNRWISKAPVTSAPTPLNLPMATLVPFVVLLATTLVTASLSAGFDWLYPLRVILVGGVLIYVWRHLSFGGIGALKPVQTTGLAILVGLVVAVVWFFTISPSEEHNQTFTQSLTEVETWVALTWLGFRFFGSVVTVPIVEELAFRGYLLCTLAKIPVNIHTRVPFSAAALIISSIVFGALHGDWVAGILAGLAYGALRFKTAHISAPIIAHSTTNLALFICAALTNNWSLI